MRPVFCGNFEYETRQGDLDRLFSKYGRVDRVDIKSGKLLRRTELPSGPMAEKFFLPACSSAPFSNGFAFVYFEDERDAEDAIRYLDGTPFGYSKRRLSVEWARGERGSQHRDGSKSLANQRPTKTLFVINFDPIRTRTIDIEKHFEPYGTILHVRIRRNFAFVQFETQEEATKALECTHMSKIMDRMVSVEYALKDDGERDSPRRGGYGRRGGSPFGRARSPDYGRDRRVRPSPDYGLPRRGRPSPDYGRNRSPVYDRYGGPSYSRDHSPDYDRYRSRSPIRRSRT